MARVTKSGARKLNVAALYHDMDVARTLTRRSWRQLGLYLGISSSTFSRMAKGKRPDADSLVSIFYWMTGSNLWSRPKR